MQPCHWVWRAYVIYFGLLIFPRFTVNVVCGKSRGILHVPQSLGRGEIA